MSEWKKLTAEQVAWLEERARAHGTSLIGAEFSMNNLETSGVWSEYVARSTKYHTPYWRMVKYGEPLKCLELQGFPMGEAVTESLAMRMASERAKQAFEQAGMIWHEEQATHPKESHEALMAYVQGAQKAAEEKEKQDDNPWRWVQGSWSEPQSQALTEHIAKVHAEQAKAKAEAEWQKERRAAWVAFSRTSMAGAADAAEWADEMLAEFDKRFGGDK